MYVQVEKTAKKKSGLFYRETSLSKGYTIQQDHTINFDSCYYQEFIMVYKLLLLSEVIIQIRHLWFVSITSLGKGQNIVP